MSNDVWIIQQKYDNFEDDYDIQIGRGSMYKYSTGVNVGSSQISSSRSNFTIPNAGYSFNQSFIKITGHKHSAGQLKAHLDYLTREGKIDIEDQRGEVREGKDADKIITDWIYDFEAKKETQFEPDKKNKRIAGSFVFSSPEGTNTEALIDSVREFAIKNFSGHRYAFVAHTPDTEVDVRKQTDNPHVHLVIETLSPGVEKSLETNPDILREWRRDFGDISKSHGIETVEMDMSRKPAPHEKNHSLYRMLKKGVIPEQYKDYYQVAKERVERGDTHLTPKENLILEKAKRNFINRSVQIDDLKTLIDSTNNGSDKKLYSSQLVYLKQLNNTTKMPTSNSQMFLKHALEQSDRKKGKGGKQFNAVPTIKHYIYAEKLAKAHGVELPPGSNVSVQRLSSFINEYGNKATPKFISLMKAVAKDRGLDLYEKDISSHMSAMSWMAENKSHPTLKQLAIANNISKQLGIDLPGALTSKSLSNFISENINTPSNQMVCFAESVYERTGAPLNSEIVMNKSKLANYISKNKSANYEKSDFIKDLESKVMAPLKEIQLDSLPEPLLKGTKEEASLSTLRKEGYYQSKDDVSSTKGFDNYVKSIRPEKESERWTKPISGIEKPVEVSERSKDRTEHDFD